MSKVDRALHGPGWGEVIVGAVLSLVLGVVLGAVLLILKPVVVAKEVPKEPAPGAVYYVEGSRDASKARQVLAKRKAFVDGQSVRVTEEEVNTLADASAANKAAAKPGDKAAPAPAPTGMIAPGTPNVRIRNGVMQVGVPVTVSVFGFDQKLIVQARGGFAKEGETFVFEPNEVYLGSCPVQRLPFLNSLIRKKVLAAQSIPEDIATAWSKLSNVTIEGNAVNLAM
jgi:hypothetical protein